MKGRLAMADVIAAALAARQAVLDAPVQVDIDGTPLRFTKADAARVRSRARSASRQHNEARPAAARTVIGRAGPQVRRHPRRERARRRQPARRRATSTRCAARSPREPAVHAPDRPALAAAHRRAAGPRAALLPGAAHGRHPGLERRRPRAAAPAARRHRGPPPTCRCSRRPTSCSASTTPPRRARRPGASSSAVAGRRRRPSTCCTGRGRRTARPTENAEELSAGDLLDAEELAERQRRSPTPAPPPSARRPTAPGPTGT